MAKRTFWLVAPRTMIQSHPVSRDGLNYDDFKKGLMMNHVTNEKEYIDGLKDVKLVEALQPGTAESE